MEPLVSVLMPCYNAAATLPMALASLEVQTHQNWECVLVDDGSNDDVHSITEAADDNRIRYIRLERNMGRGFARQVTLDNARGELVAMLDADDWLYPEKLKAQVSVMQAYPDVAVLSCGMGIVDKDGRLVGVRCRAPGGPGSLTRGRLDGLRSPPLAFGPSMVRGEVARMCRFDDGLLLAQDLDFLLQAMMGRSYGLLADVGYVYTEHVSVTPEKVLRTLQYSRRIFLKHRSKFPVASWVQVLKTIPKSLAYRGASGLGLWHQMIARRSAPPGDGDVARFEEARASVWRVARKVFPAFAGAN